MGARTSGGGVMNKTILGILMVSGTCIGGGMIAQPMVAIQYGLWPQVAMLCLVWIAMTWSALLLAKSCLHHPGTSLFSLAKNTLGTWAGRVIGTVYVLMALGSCAAYISHGGELLHAAWPSITAEIWGLGFTLLFTVLIACEKMTEKLNGLLFSLLLVCYFFVLFQESAQAWTFKPSQWEGCANLIPILFTSFSFHMIIPRLVVFFEGNAQQTSCAIVLGTTLSLSCYLLWNMALLGQVRDVSLSSTVPLFGLSFCAVATSFIGITWGFKHFIQDGVALLWRKNSAYGSLALAVIPCVLLAQKPGIFLPFLELTGGIGDSILSGLFPLAMLFVAVNQKLLPRIPPLTWTGLAMLMLFFTLVFFKTVKEVLI